MLCGSPNTKMGQDRLKRTLTSSKILNVEASLNNHVQCPTECHLKNGLHPKDFTPDIQEP